MLAFDNRATKLNDVQSIMFIPQMIPMVILMWALCWSWNKDELEIRINMK